MSFNHKSNPYALREYLEYVNSMTKLNEIQKITDHLDDELANSQKVMMNMKEMFNSIPNNQNTGAAVNNVVPHDDLLRFLASSPPQLLMDDMPANTVEVDTDVIITRIKQYTEDLRRNFAQTQPQQSSGLQRNFNNFDLGGYASTLDQLVKRLANIKLNNHDEVNNRNPALEAKLEELCVDIFMLTQMVEAKQALSESNANWSTSQNDNNTLYYDNFINKLLAMINEVTYLLQNKV